MVHRPGRRPGERRALSSHGQDGHVLGRPLNLTVGEVGALALRVLLLACVRGGGRVLHRVAAAGVRRGEAQPLLGAAQRSGDLGSAVRLQLPQLVLQELDLLLLCVDCQPGAVVALAVDQGAQSGVFHLHLGELIDRQLEALQRLSDCALERGHGVLVAPLEGLEPAAGGAVGVPDHGGEDVRSCGVGLFDRADGGLSGGDRGALRSFLRRRLLRVQAPGGHSEGYIQLLQGGERHLRGGDPRGVLLARF